MRALRAEEIELRVGRFNETNNGKVIANMLLYKDARVDMALLDEEYPNKWKREHKVINGSMFCAISVWNDDIKQWITREDVGTESMTEKEKGQASDSFKRTGVNFDIGRELYSKGCKNVAIFTDTNEVYKNTKGKWNLSFGVAFYVSHIKSENGQVTELKISDQNNKVRYTYPNKNTIKPEQPKAETTNKPGNNNTTVKPLSEGQVNRLYAIAHSKGQKRENVTLSVQQSYNITEVNQMTKTQYDEVCKHYESLSDK